MGGTIGLIFGIILGRIFLLSMTAMSGYKIQFVLPIITGRAGFVIGNSSGASGSFISGASCLKSAHFGCYSSRVMVKVFLRSAAIALLMGVGERP